VPHEVGIPLEFIYLFLFS